MSEFTSASPVGNIRKSEHLKASAASAGHLLPADEPTWVPDLYDAVLAARPRVGWDVALYSALAELSRGPVLELGAGTGRILRVLLALGVDAYGLELNDSMADAGRLRLSMDGITDPSARLVTGDMRRFLHTRRYDLIVLPFNTISVFHDDRDVGALLRRIRRHLARGGEFVFDTVLPGGFEWGAPPHTFCADPVEISVAGQPVQYREWGEFEPRHGLYTMYQRFDWSDGVPHQLTNTMRQRTPSELADLLRRQGFEFVVPPLDQRGQQVTATSQIYVARVRLASPA